MENLGSSEVTRFLIAISIMLFLGRTFGELFRQIKQASVIGEIIAGILLGPTLLGSFFPEFQDWLFPTSGVLAIAIDSITTLSVIFLLLVVGFEIDLSIVLQQGKAALIIGLTGMMVPFIIGYGVAFGFPRIFGGDENSNYIFFFFIGISLAISALPIIARTLMDLNLFKSKLGMTIMAAVIFNDFAGWLVFSVFLSLIGTKSHSLEIHNTILVTLLFVMFLLTIVRKGIHKFLPWIQSRLSWPGSTISLLMILTLLSAAFTEVIGIHAIFGAFIFGIAAGDSVHLKERTREILNQFVTNIFAPLFFVSIGLQFNFIQSFDPVIVAAVLIFGSLTKIIGCGLGSRIAGFGKSESLTIGFAMNARGLLEIVLALVAFNAGIITSELIVAIVILVLFSSVTSSPAVSYFAGSVKIFSIKDLLDVRNVIFTDIRDKKNLIREMCNAAAQKTKLRPIELFTLVWGREEQLPTGIQNYLAIPHAKVDIQRPVLLIYILKETIDFQAFDDKGSRIICLLRSPANNPEIQLNMLAQLAEIFKDLSFSQKVLEMKTPSELISFIREHI